MKTRYRILAFVLTVSVMLSSFGIAKVTHFCKMASHPSQEEPCRNAGKHDCCPDQHSPKGIRAESCCTTLVQLFKADLEPVLKAPLRVTSDQISQLQLNSEKCSLYQSVIFRTLSYSVLRYLPPESSGLHITLCTFLI